MKFQLIVDLEEPDKKIEHHHSILSIGSCFAENIGLKFTQYLFDHLINPFGILYNPLSISRALNLILEQFEYTKENLIQHNEFWHSMDHHSDYSDPNPDITLKKINNSISDAHDFIKKADWIIITLGSAHVYFLNNTPVANCHRFPQNMFTRRRLSLADTIGALTPVISSIQALNPDSRIIFTVSPVRYWRDGMTESTRSKAVLHLAIDKTVTLFEKAYYFPSYELLIDELRDYRFYSEDLAHPSSQAIDYIWDKLRGSWCSDTCKTAIEEIHSLIMAFGHRPRFPESVGSRQFEKNIEKMIDSLANRYSYIETSSLRESLTKKYRGLFRSE